VYSAILIFLASFPSALTAWNIALRYIHDKPRLAMILTIFPFLSVILIIVFDILVAVYVLIQNFTLLCVGGTVERNPFLESYRQTRMVYQAMLLSVWELIVVFFILSWDCGFCDEQPSTVNWGFYFAVVFFGFAHICNTYLTMSHAAEISVLPISSYFLYSLNVWGGYMDNKQITEALHQERMIMDLSRVSLGSFSYDRLVQCLLNSKNKVEAMDLNLDTLALLTKERCANLGMILRTLKIELFISLPLSPLYDASEVFRQFKNGTEGYIKMPEFAAGLKQLPKMCAKARKYEVENLDCSLKSLLGAMEVSGMVDEIRPHLQSKDKILFSEFCLPRVLEILQPLLRLSDPRAFAVATDNKKLIGLLKNYQPVKVYDVDEFEDTAVNSTDPKPRVRVIQQPPVESSSVTVVDLAEAGQNEPYLSEDDQKLKRSQKEYALLLLEYCDKKTIDKRDFDELRNVIESSRESKSSDESAITMPVDSNCNTVLHYATKQGNVDVVRLLLDNVVDQVVALNGSNVKGMTPIKIAKDRKNSKLIKLFSSIVQSSGPKNG